MTLTLTQFPSVHQVQFQVNGRNIGVNGSDGPVVRPTLNPINPDGLAYDTSATEFLPLYFALNDGRHDVRLIRMVPKTKQTAEATVRALLEGPSQYRDRVRLVIPDGTQLRGIRKANTIIIVDFTRPFAAAADRAAAVRTVVESLTTLPGVSGVQFMVEGASLSKQWGGDYGSVFGRRAINSES
jgi:spore germination protein GerM